MRLPSLNLPPPVIPCGVAAALRTSQSVAHHTLAFLLRVHPLYFFDFAGPDFASPYVILAAVTSLLTVGLLTDSLTLSCELLLSSSCLCSRLARMFALLRTFALLRIQPSRALLPLRHQIDHDTTVQQSLFFLCLSLCVYTYTCF